MAALFSPVWEVGVALGRGVTPVTDEEVSPRPEYGAAARVVRHGEQPLPDVKLGNIGTWDIIKQFYVQQKLKPKKGKFVASPEGA